MESVGMMDKVIRLSKSVIGEAEKKAVMGVLDREYLGMGKEVQEFENVLHDFLGRPTVCVNTGTAALHLALQALGIGPGDEVLVQSLTYVASFQAISATGATPVPCEVDPDTLTLDVNDARKRLTERTKAVMPVHYAGGMGALDEIYEFAPPAAVSEAVRQTNWSNCLSKAEVTAASAPPRVPWGSDRILAKA